VPDVIKYKRYKDDVFWVGYNNPETGVVVDFVTTKLPENERMDVGGTLSADKVGASYAKERTGNTYETFVLRSSGILPLETFKKMAAQALSQASGSKVLPANVSTYGLSYFLTAAIENPVTFECPNCLTRVMIQEHPKYCPSCGYKIAYVPTRNTHNTKAGVP
jgi:DNA-directed RNA polymerase subunit RPC12/RpoP